MTRRRSLALLLLAASRCAAAPDPGSSRRASPPLNVHVLTIPAHGHYMTVKGAALELAARGHNVTLVLCDASRGSFDADGLAGRGLTFLSAGACASYAGRAAVLADVIAGTGGVAAAARMLDGVNALAWEMCEALMGYYAADPAGRLPAVLLFDADSYCGMDASVVWRVPRVARVGTGPRDPYAATARVPAYASGARVPASAREWLANAGRLALSRYAVAWWLTPRVYSKHRREWLRRYGAAGAAAAAARAPAGAPGITPGVACAPPPAPAPAGAGAGAGAAPRRRCVDESWMPSAVPWDGVPTLYNTHAGVEVPRAMLPHEELIGYTNAFAVDAAAPLAPALARWLDASETPVVYVGLGTLAVLPAAWADALAVSMLSSRHFRFVWAVGPAGDARLPPALRLASARAFCATEPRASAAARAACDAARALAAAHPAAAARYSTPALDIPAGTAGPGGALLVEWAPQVALLRAPRVAAFLTHGGMNGLAEGSFARVPLLCAPLFSDQPDNCARAAEAGLGDELSLAALAAAVAAGAADAARGGRSGARSDRRAPRPGDGTGFPALDAPLLALYARRGAIEAAADAANAAAVAAGGVARAADVVEAAAAEPYGAHLARLPESAFAPWWAAPPGGLDAVFAVAVGAAVAAAAAAAALVAAARAAARCACARGAERRRRDKVD